MNGGNIAVWLYCRSTRLNTFEVVWEFSCRCRPGPKHFQIFNGPMMSETSSKVAERKLEVWYTVNEVTLSKMSRCKSARSSLGIKGVGKDLRILWVGGVAGATILQRGRVATSCYRETPLCSLWQLLLRGSASKMVNLKLHWRQLRLFSSSERSVWTQKQSAWKICIPWGIGAITDPFLLMVRNNFSVRRSTITSDSRYNEVVLMYNKDILK